MYCQRKTCFLYYYDDDNNNDGDNTTLYSCKSYRNTLIQLNKIYFPFHQLTSDRSHDSKEGDQIDFGGLNIKNHEFIGET